MRQYLPEISLPAVFLILAASLAVVVGASVGLFFAARALCRRFGKNRLAARLLPRQQALSYLWWGVWTTAVNWCVYFVLDGAFHYLAVNTAAWVLAVLYAYFTNRAYVFSSTVRGAAMLREAVLFAAARLFSLGAESVLLWLGIGRLGWPSLPVKVASAVIVVILNYVLSKRIVFRRPAGSNTL